MSVKDFCTKSEKKFGIPAFILHWLTKQILSNLIVDIQNSWHYSILQKLSGFIAIYWKFHVKALVCVQTWML